MSTSIIDEVLGTTIIAAEARNQPHEAKQGVAATFFNRIRTGRYGQTVAHVCLARMQYSSMNDDRQDNLNLLVVCDLTEDSPVWQECHKAFLEAAKDVDPTGGATHYYDTSIDPPYWTRRQADGRQAVRTVQLGRLVFYKDVP